MSGRTGSVQESIGHRLGPASCSQFTIGFADTAIYVVQHRQKRLRHVISVCDTNPICLFDWVFLESYGNPIEIFGARGHCVNPVTKDAQGDVIMPGPLEPIETIVIVVMANRSFDHILGYLSLKQFGGHTDVEGLKDNQDWLAAVSNLNHFDAVKFPPSPLTFLQTPDQPHERINITQQLGTRMPDGTFKMDGFVASAGGKSQVMQ